MKTFLLTLMLAVALAGCSKNFKSMKVSEVDALPEAERKELAKSMTVEEMQYLMVGTMAATKEGGKEAMKDKTVGDLIDEGKKIKDAKGE
jgi:hypothetical protein